MLQVQLPKSSSQAAHRELAFKKMVNEPYFYNVLSICYNSLANVTAINIDNGNIMISRIFLCFLLHLFLLPAKQVQQVNSYWNTHQDKSYHVEASQRGKAAQILATNPNQVLC